VPPRARKAISDKLQVSVATYFRCGGDVNGHIKKGLLLSLSVNFFKLVNIWQSYKHSFRLLAVCWPGARSARDNHALARDYWCYKILFGLVCVNSDEFFKLSPIQEATPYKLYKQRSCHSALL